VLCRIGPSTLSLGCPTGPSICPLTVGIAVAAGLLCCMPNISKEISGLTDGIETLEDEAGALRVRRVSASSSRLRRVIRWRTDEVVRDSYWVDHVTGDATVSLRCWA
jgi:hypothetical protein